MSEASDKIDWSVTTWEGSLRAQLRRTLTLTVRERMEALEDLGDVARRFQEMRAQGAFKSASAKLSEPPSTRSVHEPAAPYDDANG